jgi:PKD repeat protein
VFFYAVSSSINNGTSYVWHYGDGTSGSGNISDHHYLKPGAYRVCLNTYVKGLNGTIICHSEYCDSIHFSCSTPPPPPPAPCTAHFTFKVDSATNSVCVYPDANPTGTVYVWNFGDGNISKDVHPCHHYLLPGVYTICLTVETPASSTNGGCKNTSCQKVAVGVTTPPTNDTCSAKFRYYFDYNNPYAVKFQAAPNPAGTIYTWTFGDGDTAHTPSVSHTFRDTGLFTVCLSVSSILANALPCNDKWCRTLYINGPIANPNGSDQVMIYPNPTIGSAVVAISDVDQPVTMQIYNNKGEMIFQRESMINGSYPLDTHSMQPGLYFYRVVNGSSMISSGKLIIQ